MAPQIPRRSLFSGGAGLTLALLGLSACSSSTSTTTAGSTSTTSAPSAAPSTSSAASSASSSAAGATTTAPSGPSVAAADVPVGGGVIMTNDQYVVTQPTAGSYKAFSKICTHQGCPVAKVSGGAIICTCHNSHFSVSDGSVLSGPATKPLPEASVTVSGDLLVIG